MPEILMRLDLFLPCPELGKAWDQWLTIVPEPRLAPAIFVQYFPRKLRRMNDSIVEQLT